MESRELAQGNPTPKFQNLNLTLPARFISFCTPTTSAFVLLICSVCLFKLMLVSHPSSPISSTNLAVRSSATELWSAGKGFRV